VSCGKFGANLFSHLLLYLQISSFASIPSDSNESSGISQLASLLSQFRPIVAFVSGACYGPSIGAYNATASKLIGPLVILSLSAVWTRILAALEPRLHLRNIQIHVSYSGTLATTSLFVFSNVASVVFTLVECTRYDASGVVFIDGTVGCLDRNWTGLMVIIVLLCLFPVAFFLALWRNKLPDSARLVVCRVFTERVFYWPALTLGFRLLISVLQFLQSVNPTLLAFLRTVLSLGMSILLTNLRPHTFDHAYWMDVACYSCLVLQFSLQTIFAGVDFLAVTVTAGQREFFDSMRSLSLAFRFVCSVVQNCCALVLNNHVLCTMHIIYFTCAVRFFPVVVFVIVWLRSKIYLGNTLKSVGGWFWALVLRAKRRAFRQADQHLEMRQPMNPNAMSL
jgi:hypothetical protein